MDCATARAVWGNPDGYIPGLKATCPGVVEHLDRHVRALLDGSTNPFQDAVRNQIGGGPFYMEHADTDDDPFAHLVHDVVGDAAGRAQLERYFSDRYGVPITLGNVCCSACAVSRGPLSFELVQKIQQAAIRTEPNGTIIDL